MIEITTAEKLGYFPNVYIHEVKNDERGKHLYAGGMHSEYEEAVIRAIIDKEQPKIAYEFGTYYGCRTEDIKLYAPKCRVITVDIDGISKRPAELGELRSAEIVQANLFNWCPDKQDYGCVDLVFVDADHSLAGVASDTRLAVSLVREGGLIVWHDVFVPTHNISTWRDINHYLEQGLDVAYFLAVKFPEKVYVIRGTTLAVWRKP